MTRCLSGYTQVFGIELLLGSTLQWFADMECYTRSLFQKVNLTTPARV